MSCMPRICVAYCSASWMFFATFTPPPLAAASGVNLRLYHDAAGTACKELLGHIQRFVERVGHLTPRHGNAVFRQDVFRLILVDFHSF